jgi:FKBP-type peptidyl-prolyl cis-trans isomerase 2
MSPRISKRTGLSLAAVAALMCMALAPGCLTGNQVAPQPAFSMTVIGGGQKAVAGDNLTFIVKMRNNQAQPQTAAISVSFMPASWAVALSNATFEFTSKGSRAVFVCVTVSGNTPMGNYNVKVRAASVAKASDTGSATLHVEVVAPGRDLVETGSNVKVDYTGYLSDFSVFDSSVKAVGSDLGIPKSSSFNPPTDNIYSPLAFQVGKGQMIKGFDAGVVGMMNGQSRTIRVEPADGYGQFKNVQINITETFSMIRNISILNFTSAYGEEPALNKVVTEPHWDWQVQVLAVTSDTVTLMTLPQSDQVSQPYGWDTKVLDINGTADGGAGRITVRHYPTAGVNATYEGSAAQITSMTSTVIELTYNTASSNPLATQPLFFSVRIVSIQ